MKHFVLTEDHIKLLSVANIETSDVETGAPEIDGKRPYGNSDVPGDVIEELGWTWDKAEYDEPPRSMRERALATHFETTEALQVILQCQTFETGEYVKDDGYSAKWRKA